MLAPAKVNLGLKIQGQLNTGYHRVETIYCQLNFGDEVILKENSVGEVIIRCSDASIIQTENLAYRAAVLLTKHYHIKQGIVINVKKVIPNGSGLGGGSSDAAVVLRGLNQLWQLGLDQNELIVLAKSLGSDVAYQLVGGVKEEEQGGDRAGSFIDLGKLPTCTFVVCVPPIRCLSKLAYREIPYHLLDRQSLQPLQQAIKNKDLSQIAASAINDFELWILNQHPELQEIKASMVNSGALFSLMSGKGSAVFGVFDDQKLAVTAAQNLKILYQNTWVTTPYISEGN